MGSGHKRRRLAGSSPRWTRTFEGQREAAIRDRAAGLTLIRPRFRNVPTAISIDANAHDELWVKDGRFEDISGAAVIIGLEENPRTEINMENAVCRRVPVFASFRESGRKVNAPGEIYAVKTFSHGLHFSDLGRRAGHQQRVRCRTVDRDASAREVRPARSAAAAKRG